MHPRHALDRQGARRTRRPVTDPAELARRIAHLAPSIVQQIYGRGAELDVVARWSPSSRPGGPSAGSPRGALAGVADALARRPPTATPGRPACRPACWCLIRAPMARLLNAPARLRVTCSALADSRHALDPASARIIGARPMNVKAIQRRPKARRGEHAPRKLCPNAVVRDLALSMTASRCPATSADGCRRSRLPPEPSAQGRRPRQPSRGACRHARPGRPAEPGRPWTSRQRSSRRRAAGRCTLSPGVARTLTDVLRRRDRAGSSASRRLAALDRPMRAAERPPAPPRRATRLAIRCPAAGRRLRPRRRRDSVPTPRRSRCRHRASRRTC